MAPSSAGAMVTTDVVCNGVRESFPRLENTLTISLNATQLGFPVTARTCPTGFTEIRVTGDEAAQVLSFTATAGFTATLDLLGGNDELTMVSASQSVVAIGGAGADSLRGGNGSDVLFGGAGDDSLLGGGGNDALDGGAGRDTATWEERATPVVASLDANAGAEDTLAGIEDLLGGTGNDTLTGDGGPNILRGNDGDDILRAGGGDDTLQGGYGRDTLDGGTGIDASTWEERNDPVSASLLTGVGAEDALTLVESLTGSRGNDTLIGDAGPNVLRGDYGDDRIDGGGGADALDGGFGSDGFIGGAGDDVVLATDGERDAFLDCGPGYDRASSDAIIDAPVPVTNCEVSTAVAGVEPPRDSAVPPAAVTSPNLCIDETGSRGWCGDGRRAQLAKLAGPTDVAVATDGSLLIADTRNNVIRRVRPARNGVYGEIATIAGSGERGPARNTLAASATFDAPEGIALAGGVLLVADTGNDRIRSVTADRRVHTVQVSGARIKAPRDIVGQPDGSVLVVNSGRHEVLRILPGGTAQRLAGIGRAGFSGDGGPAIRASLRKPGQLSVARDGSLFIADTGNGRIRRISPSPARIMSTFARGLDQPRGVLALADGAVLVSTPTRLIRLERNGRRSTVAGTTTAGYNGDGAAASVRFAALRQLAVSRDNHVLVAERGNDRIRELLTRGPALRMITQRSGSAAILVNTAVGGGPAKERPIPPDRGLSPGRPPPSMRGANDNGDCRTYSGPFNVFYARPRTRALLGRASQRVTLTLVMTKRSARVVVEVFRLESRGYRRVARTPTETVRPVKEKVSVILTPLRADRYVLKLWGRAGPPDTLRCHIRPLRVTAR